MTPLTDVSGPNHSTERTTNANIAVTKAMYFTLTSQSAFCVFMQVSRESTSDR